MLKLPQKTLENIKKILTRQKSEVETNLKEVEKNDPALSPSLAESSEPGTDSWIAEAHTKTIAFKDQLKKISDSIKNALLRMRKGTYGKCERCGKPIETSRLSAIPIATLCLSCSKKPPKKQ